MLDFSGQGALQLGELGLAFLLSALVGLEREMKQKSAGLRTNTLVGGAAALFMLISKYGFADVLRPGLVIVDPSRVAAQVVSGIGFIGGGVIFMRRDVVRGLTTAASVWLTAALGMACGAGLPVLAIATTIGHFVIMLAFPKLLERLPARRRTMTRLDIAYADGRGLLRRILIACTELRFAIEHVSLERGVPALAGPEAVEEAAETGPPPRLGLVAISLRVKGKRPIGRLVERLSEIDGVAQVGAADETALD